MSQAEGSTGIGNALSTPRGKLWLASTSPRRVALLGQLGVVFEQCAVEVDESVLAGESAGDYVRRVATEKLTDGMARLRRRGEDSGTVLAADTVVVVDGDMLGKPASREEALQMLSRLSGRSHQVLSCVALGRLGQPGPPEPLSAVSESTVWFREVNAPERERYWATGEPAGKAGGYAIQGLAAAFVAHLEGSYSGVMGLPLYETSRLLREAGVAQVV